MDGAMPGDFIVACPRYGIGPGDGGILFLDVTTMFADRLSAGDQVRILGVSSVRAFGRQESGDPRLCFSSLYFLSSFADRVW